MKRLLLYSAFLALLFNASIAVAEVQVLVYIQHPSGGTFKVIERATVFSRGQTMPTQSPAVEYQAGSRFQKVYSIEDTEGYNIVIQAVSGKLEDVEVSVTDYAMKLMMQPRAIPGSNPPAATFSFNATEFESCCGD